MSKTLEGILDEHGLDKDFWHKKFKDTGITNAKQLKHADKEVLNQLTQYKRYQWEENALRACFPSISEPSKEEKQERIEKMDKSLNVLLQKLDTITDEKGRMERMKIKFEIPPGQRDLHKELTKMEFLTNELAVRENLTPSQIVTKISSGRIMKGYYIEKDVWNRVLPRRRLIDIPGDVEILGPRMEEAFTSTEFFSEKKSGLYDHVVNHWGFNAALSGGVIGAFSADIGFAMQKTDDESSSEESQGGFTEIKETVYVPAASFCLENVPHFISSDALKALVKLEENLKDPSKTSQFFQEFGSHYFAGTYHLGGRYTRTVVCRSNTTMTKSESIKLSKWALQGGVAGIYGEFTLGVQAGFEKSNDESSSKFKEDEDYKVEKRIIKCGGPPEADSIPQWKLGLVKYPKTWAVIDQDVHKDEWKGVWELLGNEHASKFSDIEKIRSTLKQEWENEFQEKLEANRKPKKQAESQ